MSSLLKRDAPYDLSLPFGVTVTVKPLNTPGMLMARMQAQARMRADHGEIEDAAKRESLHLVYLIHALAEGHIISINGLEGVDDPVKAAQKPEIIRAVMDVYPIGERFYTQFTTEQILMNQAKNASGVSASGISHAAEAQATAPDAAT